MRPRDEIQFDADLASDCRAFARVKVTDAAAAADQYVRESIMRALQSSGASADDVTALRGERPEAHTIESQIESSIWRRRLWRRAAV